MSNEGTTTGRFSCNEPNRSQIGRNTDTEESRQMWAKVDSAAAKAPEWLRDNVRRIANERHRRDS